MKRRRRQCSDCSVIDPALGGWLVFHGERWVLANCWERGQRCRHLRSAWSAELVDRAAGTAVTSPQGDVYVNCHVHF